VGWGDEIMVTAAARKLQQADARKVAVRNRHGAARWDAIWENNPRIATPDEVNALYGVGFQYLDNAPKRRPYIDDTTPERFTFNGWRVADTGPGEIYLTEAEAALGRKARGAIVIEPNLKPRASPNKQWGVGKWKDLVRMITIAGYEVVQLGDEGTHVLRNARLIITRTPRQACGVLSGARGAVLPEGGLHHAAAALGIPAAVIFGGYIAPSVTGYDFDTSSHRNIFTGGERWPYGCGHRVSCRHCIEAMEQITARQVFQSLEECLGHHDARGGSRFDDQAGRRGLAAVA
jgi:hypothetical protein